VPSAVAALAAPGWHPTADVQSRRAAARCPTLPPGPCRLCVGASVPLPPAGPPCRLAAGCSPQPYAHCPLPAQPPAHSTHPPSAQPPSAQPPTAHASLTPLVPSAQPPAHHVALALVQSDGRLQSRHTRRVQLSGAPAGAVRATAARARRSKQDCQDAAKQDSVPPLFPLYMLPPPVALSGSPHRAHGS
jgi:hypothetical protein